MNPPILAALALAFPQAALAHSTLMLVGFPIGALAPNSQKAGSTRDTPPRFATAGRAGVLAADTPGLRP